MVLTIWIGISQLDLVSLTQRVRNGSSTSFEIQRSMQRSTTKREQWSWIIPRKVYTRLLSRRPKVPSSGRKCWALRLRNKLREWSEESGCFTFMIVHVIPLRTILIWEHFRHQSSRSSRAACITPFRLSIAMAFGAGVHSKSVLHRMACAFLHPQHFFLCAHCLRAIAFMLSQTWHALLRNIVDPKWLLITLYTSTKRNNPIPSQTSPSVSAPSCIPSQILVSHPKLRYTYAILTTESPVIHTHTTILPQFSKNHAFPNRTFDDGQTYPIPN